MTVFALSNVTKYYDHFLAVSDLSFSAESSQIIALLGSNGAGKSTAIKMLCGLSKPSAGEITVFDKKFSNFATQIKKEIGYVPEESALYEDVTVFQYLLFFGSLYGLSKDVIMKRAKTLLAELDLDAGDKLIAELSKGMKRKVLIARSLLHDPKLLIYDEPASGLDPQTSAFILTFIQELQRKGKTIIFSSHNLVHVEKIAQRVIIIHKGKMAFDGTVKELTTKKHTSYTVTYRETNTSGNAESVGKEHTASHTLAQIQEIAKKHEIVEIVSHQPTVEDAFFSLIKEK